jgi:hypothetical protein
MMMGSNDFCFDICYVKNQDSLVETARANLIRALRILRVNLPRTLVNLVIPVGNDKKNLFHVDLRIFTFVALQM